MIQLLDLESSTEDTPRRRKWINEERTHGLVKDNVKCHDNRYEDDDDSLISHHSNTSHLSTKSESTKYEKYSIASPEPEKVTNDPTLSWFAGACHVWQSTEDETEERIEYDEDIKSEVKSKGLWKKISSANVFGGFSGLNIYKNLNNQNKSTITQKHKSKYFWSLQNKSYCDCKRILRSKSSGGVFGWANTGFSDESSNKTSSQTPVLDLQKGDQHCGKYILYHSKCP